MAWSADLQEVADGLANALIERCRLEVSHAHSITLQTDPCRHLGICEADLDEVQIDAARKVGLRPPVPSEPLIIPWHGPERRCTIADLAAWLAVNGRPLP